MSLERQTDRQRAKSNVKIFFNYSDSVKFHKLNLSQSNQLPSWNIKTNEAICPNPGGNDFIFKFKIPEDNGCIR